MAPSPSPAPKCSATRIRSYKTEVTVTHEGNRVVVELPRNFDMSLFPEGSYRLEATLAAIVKLKLVERPRGAPDIQEVEDVSAKAET